MASSSPKPQLLSGARGLIKYIDSKGATQTLGIATDISINTRENLRPSYVIGQIGPVSIEPLSLDVDCSIGRLVPVNLTTGLPKSVSAIDLGLEEKINEILTTAAIEIQIYDKSSTEGEVLVSSIKEARFTGRSLSVSSGDVAQERLNFVGIYDAAGPGQAPDETGY